MTYSRWGVTNALYRGRNISFVRHVYDLLIKYSIHLALFAAVRTFADGVNAESPGSMQDWRGLLGGFRPHLRLYSYSNELTANARLRLRLWSAAYSYLLGNSLGSLRLRHLPPSSENGERKKILSKFFSNSFIKDKRNCKGGSWELISVLDIISFMQNFIFFSDLWSFIFACHE